MAQQQRMPELRPYRVMMEQQETTHGQPVWVVWHPELDWLGVHRCISQGNTPQEALDNLADAQRLLVASLIEDGLEIPPARPGKRTELTRDRER